MRLIKTSHDLGFHVHDIHIESAVFMIWFAFVLLFKYRIFLGIFVHKEMYFTNSNHF